MKPKSFILALFIITLFQGGCASPPNNSLILTPLRPDPLTPTQQSSAYPTAVVSDNIPLKQYSHSTSRFSINYPDNWQFFERADGVVFIEPGNHAGYSVFFSDVGESYPPEKISQYLATFLANNFVDSASKFSAYYTKPETDGSMVVRFTSIDPKLGKAISEVQVFQRDTIVFILLINTAEEQWTISRSKLKQLVNSFKPLDTKPAVKATATPIPIEWILIGPTSNQFGFFYPNNWKILAKDESLVSVAMADQDIIFTAKSYVAPQSIDDPNAARKAAETYLETVKKQYGNMQNRPPTEFPLDKMSGTTIDFLYKNEVGIDMAGSVITAVSNGKIYQLVFTAPAILFKESLNWFNPMYKSFKVLDEEN